MRDVTQVTNVSAVTFPEVSWPTKLLPSKVSNMGDTQMDSSHRPFMLFVDSDMCSDRA